ncbi:MAG: restriction endonuclease subunit S [Cyclobacteriaceae bacterium]
MSKWKKHKIGDLFLLEYGKALADYRTGFGQYEVFGTNGKIGLTDTYLYCGPSVIIGRKGAYREVHFAKTPFYVIDTAFYTKQKTETTNIVFAYYWFKDIDINSMDSGSAIPSTSRDEVYDLDISLPPLTEQTAIAEVLSSLDDKIDLLHRQNQTLEQLAETLFRQWFVEEAEESWEEKSLDEIATFLNGLACQKYPPNQNELGLPVIKIKEMKAGISESSDRATAEVDAKYLVHDGDMLFSWSGSLDIVLWSGGVGVLNQHLFKVSSEVYPQWFYYFWTQLHLVDFRGVAEDKATTMGHIQRHHLSDAKVLVPTKSELDKIDNQINPLFLKIKSNSTQIRTLTQLRDTLLPKLVSGEVRVH